VTTYRDVLRHSEFRGLLVAQVCSEWGDNIARVALASLVLARTDSAFLAVLAFVVSFIPAVFGSALLGGLSDRLPRKVVLIGCDLARAVVVGVLALVAVEGTPVWVLLGLLLVAETFTAPFEAAHRAVVPDVLPDPRECLTGTGLMRILYQVDQVLGIVAAGVVIVLVGERAGLLFDVATFLVSATVLALTLRWRPASRDHAVRTTLVGDFRAGWRFARHARAPGPAPDSGARRPRQPRGPRASGSSAARAAPTRAGAGAAARSTRRPRARPAPAWCAAAGRCRGAAARPRPAT
jgi:MFS family permease